MAPVPWKAYGVVPLLCRVKYLLICFVLNINGLKGHIVVGNVGFCIAAKGNVGEGFGNGSHAGGR